MYLYYTTHLLCHTVAVGDGRGLPYTTSTAGTIEERGGADLASGVLIEAILFAAGAGEGGR